jgi:hypothetical protein
LFCDETPIGHGVPLDQALRAVFESVGQRIGSDVAHRQRPAFFFEDEIHTARQVLDRSRSHIATYANALMHGR